MLNGEPPANNAPVVVDAVPGSVWRYSGGGYTVMQQVLSDVAGGPFPELMGRLVFEPAGMLRSTFAQPLPPSLEGEAARGFADGEVVPGGWHVWPACDRVAARHDSPSYMYNHGTFLCRKQISFGIPSP